MSNALAHTRLIALDRALEAAATAIKLVIRVPAPLKPIADQVIRSASSVPANLAEGHGRSGRDRQHHWRIAYASAKEVDTFLHLLAGASAVDQAQADRALALFDQASDADPGLGLAHLEWTIAAQHLGMPAPDVRARLARLPELLSV